MSAMSSEIFRVLVGDLGGVLSRCGADVAAVESGFQALELVKAGEPFDCFICDLGMSDMDGFSTYAAEADRQKALAAGFDGFLAKPVNLHELASDIAALLTVR